MASDTGTVEPIFVSVKDAARLLGGISPFVVYQLLDRGQIASQYQGRRRLVLLKSLREYAKNLPSTPESA